MDDSDNDSEANQFNRFFILFAISAPYFVMDTTKADVLLKNRNNRSNLWHWLVNLTTFVVGLVFRRFY